jgi:hypothetical protein
MQQFSVYKFFTEKKPESNDLIVLSWPLSVFSCTFLPVWGASLMNPAAHGSSFGIVVFRIEGYPH